MDWSEIIKETLQNMWTVKELYYPIIAMYGIGIIIRIKKAMKG